MEIRKKKEITAVQVLAVGQKPELEKFYKQVIKSFGYEYQRRA